LARGVSGKVQDLQFESVELQRFTAPDQAR
jgi:hypothetical protein